LQDKRRHLRVPANYKAIMINGNESKVNFIRDISSSGVFIETIELPKIGDTVYLMFSLHHPEKTVRTSAKVVRRVEPVSEDELVTSGVGLEFVDMPFESSVLVEDYVVHVRYSYEELMLVLGMKNPDMKRLGQLLKKINIGSYRDFFELKEKIKKTAYSMGILKDDGEKNGAHIS
jgi:Tfp pilus assembly protein PilZ